MQYTLYKGKDNAEGQLDSSIGASTLSIVLKTGLGANFPQPYSGTTTSGGDSQTLNKTGIGALGIAVGDFIENTTDGSHAFVTVVNTNSLTTTILQGGSTNTWNNADAYLVNAFIGTLNKRNTSGVVTAFEKVKITGRSSDTLTVATACRGYDGSVAQAFNADDYFNLFVTTKMTEETRKALTDISQQMDLKASMLYVQASLSARNWKDSVVVATTVAGTLATSFENGDTVDGVVLTTGDRVLIKNQVDQKENGVYIVNVSGSPTRATDFDSTAEITSAVIAIIKGTSNADTVWICTSDSPTIGVNNIVFAQVGASLAKASLAEAQAAVDDTKFITPLRVVDSMKANQFKILGGTGADGDLTVSGTTTLNLNQVYNYNNVVINGTLTFTGAGTIALLNIAGNLSGSGTIELRNTSTGDVSTYYMTANGPICGGTQMPTVAPNNGGAGGVAGYSAGAGGVGGTSTVAGAGTGGTAGAIAGTGGAGAGGGSSTGGGGGGGGGAAATNVGIAGSAASGVNGGAGGAGGAGGVGNNAGGSGGGGGGGYNTGNGGAGGAAGNGMIAGSLAMPSTCGNGGVGGASGANGGNGGAGGTGASMTNAQGAAAGTYNAGHGGNGGWGFANGGNGGGGGVLTSSATGAGTVAQTCGNGGNGGNSLTGTGGTGGAAGGLAWTTTNAPVVTLGTVGNGGDGRTGGNGGSGSALAGAGLNFTGGNGGNGGASKTGCCALYISIQGNSTFNGTINGQGGNGGNGGNGGASIGTAANSNGGNGGAGSKGADVIILSTGTTTACTINNLGGVGGSGGAAGISGSGAAGRIGLSGANGANGIKIVQQMVI